MRGQRQNVAEVIAAVGGNAEVICAAIAKAGLVIVPRIPTAKMLDDAWADIHEEDGPKAWRDMIESYEGTL